MSCFESSEDTDQCHSKVAPHNPWKVLRLEVNLALICEKIMEWVLLKHTFGHIKEGGDGE